MIDVEVTTRGEVSEQARQQARDKVAALERFVKGPILGARVVLTQESNPRVRDRARAEAEIDLQGRLVRARTAAPSMEAAVDEVVERLRRHLRRYVDRLITRHHKPAEAPPAEAPPGEWSPRMWSPPHRPAFEPQADEREIVRRKSFAFGPMTVDEGADALEDLDQDFFLFRDAETGAEAVLYWRDDGLLALIEPPWAELTVGGPVREPSMFSEPMALETAVAQMNAVSHRFLFFENAATGRGNVIYRRYDGDYGLIEPDV
jgi:ribosomal subunit interface protein